MEEQLVWNVLGMAPAKDEEVLKDRYHELLKGVNPEDDPEGFKRLRQAYETALELLRKPEETETETGPKDEIDLWLDRVNDVYWYASTRNNPELWKELFQDDVCIALDTALEARERFIAYLMQHVYVNQEIWNIIDKEFHLIDDVEELKEKFPKDFLDYARYQVENQHFFSYEKLEILALDESEVQLDDYINAYFRCKGDIDRENYENMWQRIDDLKAFEVYHPYEDVERIRLHLQENQPEAAIPFVEKLLEKEPDDVYIGYWSGRVFWALEQWEKARDCWQHVVDILPAHYTSRVGLAEYYIKTEDYVKAKELIMDLLEANGRDEHVLDLMRIVNEPLIEYYKNKASEENYKKNMIEACWCMFQNEMFQKTLEELERLNIQPDDTEYYDYVNMKGRCFVGLENYADAIEYLLKWEEARQKLVDDGSEKYQKRISREGFIKSAIGVAYQNLKEFELAEKYLSEGIEKEKDDAVRHSFMDRLALLYYDFKYYEKCMDVCTKIVEEDPGYYPAYLRRQEAAYEKKDGQQVIDDYYNAIYIFPKYYKPYLLAVQVFCIYHQYADAKKVLDLAKEQEVHQELLSFYEIRVMRNLAATDEEYRKALELCQKLQEELDEESEKRKGQDKPESEMTEAELLEEDRKRDGMPKDAVNQDDLTFERILIYMDDLEENDTALKLIAEEIERGSSDYRLRWLRADIYRRKRKYKEALDEYGKLKQEMPDNVELDYSSAICLQRLGRTEEAIQLFRKVLERDPKHPRAHHELMKIYSRRYDMYELKSAYGLALKEITAQLQLVPSAYYYIERGLLYMDNFNFDLALADYRKALELEPENIYAYNNIGYVYQAKGQFEEAITYFSKSIELMTDERTLLPYTNTASCYEAMCQWDRAIDILEESLKHFKPTASIFDQMAELYACKKDVDMVIKVCDRARELKLMSRTIYYRKISHAYFATGNLKEGEKVLARWNNASGKGVQEEHERVQEKFDAILEWGVYYFYHRECKKALPYLEDAWKLAKKHGLYCVKVGVTLSKSYYMCKQWAKARAIAKDTLNYMLKDNHVPAELKNKEPEDPESIQYFLSYRPLAPLRLFNTAELFIAMGELEKAGQMLNRGGKVPRCRHCTYGECCDTLMIQAFLEEIKGNIKEAIRLYEKAQQINPSDIEPALSLDVLRSRKDGHK